MGAKSSNPSDPRSELRVMREKHRNALQKIQELEKALSDSNQIEVELISAKDMHNSLFTQLELKKQELEFVQKALTQSNQRLADRNKSSKIVSFCGDVIFLISTAFATWGINYLTSTPSNSTGWFLLVAGAVIFLTYSLITKLLLFGGTD